MDGHEISNLVQRQSKPLVQGGIAGISRYPTRIGPAIFDQGTKQKEVVPLSKNLQPNFGQRMDDQGGLVFSSFSSSSVEKSGASTVKAKRRMVKVQSHKRKAKEVVLTDITNTGKRPQLQLRDEEIQSTVEATMQPRRSQ